MGIPKLSLQTNSSVTSLECDLCYSPIHQHDKFLFNDRTVYCCKCIDNVFVRLRKDMKRIEKRMKKINGTKRTKYEVINET